MNLASAQVAVWNKSQTKETTTFKTMAVILALRRTEVQFNSRHFNAFPSGQLFTLSVRPRHIYLGTDITILHDI